MGEVKGVLRSSGVARDQVRVVSCDAEAGTVSRVRKTADVRLSGVAAPICGARGGAGRASAPPTGSCRPMGSRRGPSVLGSRGLRDRQGKCRLGAGMGHDGAHSTGRVSTSDCWWPHLGWGHQTNHFRGALASPCRTIGRFVMDLNSAGPVHRTAADLEPVSTSTGCSLPIQGRHTRRGGERVARRIRRCGRERRREVVES